MMIKRQTRAFTLVEVLVFSVVALMLMGLLAQIFITATKRTEDARLKVDLQQTAILIMRELDRDLAKTKLQRNFSPDEPGVPSAVGEEEDSEHYVFGINKVAAFSGSEWDGKRTVYFWSKVEKTLTKEEIPQRAGEPASTPYPVPFSDAELKSIATETSGQERFLSSYVEEFWLEDRSNPPSKTKFQNLPIKLRLKLRRPLSTSDRYAEFIVEKYYALRNR